jgi:hypothetical protein
MISLSENNQETLHKEFVTAIKSGNIDEYIREVETSGEIYIPESLPWLRKLIAEDLRTWEGSFNAIATQGEWFTGLYLYDYFLRHINCVDVEVALNGLDSDLQFVSAINEMMKNARDISYKVILARGRLIDRFF